MNQQYSAMRSNVSMLGKLLGDTIKDALGEDILDKVESIRKLSKSSRAGNEVQRQKLLMTLQTLTNDELLPVARAFNQFLNLTNVAEQYHSISPHGEAASNPVALQKLFGRLKEHDFSHEDIQKAVEELSIELVLTAHPTEIARRTLIHKLVEVNTCLSQLDHDDLADYERNNIMRRLRQLVAQSWHTDEIRKIRPTPIDEAKWGFAVVENSLWEGVPAFLREFNEQLEESIGAQLPVEANPIRFTSWMGGDRDGNPNVTAEVTRHVLLLSRWKAADLFLKDIQVLVSELSMTEATPELRALAGGDEVDEPYRQIAKNLRSQLFSTLEYLERRVKGEQVLPPADLLTDNAQLWDPLYACYQSLVACNMSIIANGSLLDTLRRIRSFGLQLVRIDVRQESTRHTDALSELTEYLGLGNYGDWSEQEKQDFLLTELQSRRPLIPQNWQPTPETQEVFETCRVIAKAKNDSIAAYVISMAKVPSDVLAVKLLLKEAGASIKLPVAPLFETLEDLNNAESVMTKLLSIEWYRELIDDRQMVMIGYSDSAKDAGVMAASWAQYRAQDALIKLCDKEGVKLTLFHGRGGTIGRGGAPAHSALLSQPPGSLKGGLRVTEQGEMIRFKFGLPQVTISSLAMYASAILEANLLPPPEPKEAWKSVMNSLSDVSCAMYRDYVREQPDFVPYFRAATPELELGKLPLGSRPAKRRPTGGVETLRAIPWIFAWTQNRLMLPAWLGAGAALKHVIEKEGKQAVLDEMWQEWTFFKTRIAMLEMVYAKADLWLAEYYDHCLVEKRLWPLGQKLRDQLSEDIKSVLAVSKDEALMADLPWIAESIALRNVYTDPLNVLQAELLQRSRQQEHPDPRVEQALMVTIAGVAAGMRNTG
ncbi:TPA: phosphoenolpyruvate carboxylase [Providencia alcalifaciens]|uniref:Phosphoenolpyruvate carboxylase n=3 Tax=Enterobacterales TaxID=91347 RepID=A0AAV3M4V3_9GAMM|nr:MULTISPECIES: phosphoenolpyruvate carboxylase [Providencia]ETT07706.1 phosphoenolpyruvate carboxylase [Providencia alcalifaciens F90-2004]EUC94975.1 phosphoenolpyruvate carboxylase [Providencia alcalifaciens PAL-2]EUD04790.1 phosphoenolpyruvate carboxylase [Providencia alcalifaciens RIMD 1656011]EUD10742.1 phosphoenolpyruvate carboxylase [Providencia alcalifaciens 205/92]MBF0692570.1 phosphoenolpyruvate carboxylase [Providencia alcalifaciens]